MRQIAFETVTDALVLVGEFAAMVLLSALGLLAERAGVAHLASGIDPATVWLFVVGSVALYAGIYMLGYRTVLPRFLPARESEA